MDVFCKYASNITNYITSAVGLLTLSDTHKVSSQTFLSAYENLYDYLSFDEFQVKLLKGFLFLLSCNVLLIWVSWKIYGKRICERFMKPATSKAIDELKASVSKLKLPKEHSPRN